MLVLSIHGIETDYPWNWQDELYSVFPPESYRTYKYGYVSRWDVLPVPKPFPAALQRIAGDAQQFYQAYDKMLTQHKGAIPSVIAHSYGSVILAQALKTYDQLHLDKVILLGSVVYEHFDWPSIWRRGQFLRLRNELAFSDTLVKAVGIAPEGVRKLLRPIYGKTGTAGFPINPQTHPWFSQPPFEHFDHSSHHVTIRHANHHWVNYLSENQLWVDWTDMTQFDRLFQPLLTLTMEILHIHPTYRQGAYSLISAKIAFYLRADHPRRTPHDLFRDFVMDFIQEFPNSVM